MAKKKKRITRKKIKIFDGLKESLEMASAYEQGHSVNLRVQELPPPPKRIKPREIKQIRNALNASQAIFAKALNVSTRAVQSWEQGDRIPSHATLKLLAIAKVHPEILLEA